GSATRGAEPPPRLLRRKSWREEKHMIRTRFFSILALIALVAGCAGPSARVGSSESGEDGSALPAARELNATWHGSYWDLGIGNSHDGGPEAPLRHKEDAAFREKGTRSPRGTKNLDGPSGWWGGVVTKGNRVILQDRAGLWPNLALRRSGNNFLYGTSLD